MIRPAGNGTLRSKAPCHTEERYDAGFVTANSIAR